MSTDGRIKDRRKALGWSRAELAERAGIDPHIVQLVELDQWTETDALGRLEYVLKSAEAGNRDIRLGRLQAPEGQQVIAGGEAAATPEGGDNGAG